MSRKIVVEALIPAPVEVVWERTRARATRLLGHPLHSYRLPGRARRARVPGSRLPHRRRLRDRGRWNRAISSFDASRALELEFDSEDWKSIIRNGRGVWIYESRPEGTYFKTVYDYDRRYGILGRVLDGLLFRRLLQLATEWGFETLRLWCSGQPEALVARRSRTRFLRFYLRRLLFAEPAPGAARSWLGSGRTSS